LEACPRREVWAASNLEETWPADLQGWIARLSSPPRNCACKRRSVPPVVQRTLRHTDIKATMRFYVHADADVHRAALA
jgi:hypothetical protein